MSEAIEVTPQVTILPAALEVHAIRSSGPGGQNVNKVSSKILLLVDLDGVEGLDVRARRRLVSLAGRRIAADGRLLVTAGESRDRYRNLMAAREKVRELVARALVVPKIRRPSEPTIAARERRLRRKKRDAGVKAIRRQRPEPEEE